jgi:hypothetical protein
MVPQELVLRRHHTCGLGDDLANVRKPFQSFFVRQKVRGGMIIRGLLHRDLGDRKHERFGVELKLIAR